MKFTILFFLLEKGKNSKHIVVKFSQPITTLCNQRLGDIIIATGIQELS